MKLVLNNEEPIFIQIAQAIEDEILSNGIKEEEQVPSTTELSKLYKINPATVLKGINILVDKNILYKKRGIGMFVSEGAKTIIKEARKENFKHNFIKNLLQEAEKLEINREELVDIIINFKEDIRYE
ncbi:GntR family transcriptional regulator [Clostridioides difficile]|nr:GntR family transcriptional regulator [Clostridioides difficile]